MHYLWVRFIIGSVRSHIELNLTSMFISKVWMRE
jgi:hypothetical protein